MRQFILTSVIALILSSLSLAQEGEELGRYQSTILTVQGRIAENGVILTDTVTGQTWRRAYNRSGGYWIQLTPAREVEKGFTGRFQCSVIQVHGSLAENGVIITDTTTGEIWRWASNGWIKISPRVE